MFSSEEALNKFSLVLSYPKRILGRILSDSLFPIFLSAI